MQAILFRENTILFQQRIQVFSDVILDVGADRFVVAFQQAGFDYTGRVSVLVEYPVFSIPQGVSSLSMSLNRCSI